MLNTREFKEPILMFSGGKDSLLCLLMLQDQLDHINVVFVNTGKMFPEALSFIDTIRELCPKYIELNSDRDSDWEINGIPADVIVPMKGNYQSVKSCHYKNIMLPVVNLIKAMDSRLVIRGSKNTDQYHDGIQSLSVVQGTTIYNPIENFTDYQVREALKTYDHLVELPDYFSFEHTSLDCMDCTGFLDKTKDRLELLHKKYPDEYYRTKANIEKIIEVSEDELITIRKAIL